MSKGYIVGTFWHNIKTALLGDARNKCMVCGRDVFDHSGLCDACTSVMPLNNGKTCIRCGASLPGVERYCYNCSRGNKYMDSCRSVFIYEHKVPIIVHSIKYGNSADRCYPLAMLLVSLAKQHNMQYDIVCNVPMTASATSKRGFNQALLLAHYFCDIIGIKAYQDALVKIRDTLPQEGLSRNERLTNVTNAYRADKDKVKGKSVLLIDDVMTTGSTLDNCAKVLKKAGATVVYCITVASGNHNLSMEDNDGSIY